MRSHVAHVNESCHTCESSWAEGGRRRRASQSGNPVRRGWQMSMSLVTHMDESCPKCEESWAEGGRR